MEGLDMAPDAPVARTPESLRQIRQEIATMVADLNAAAAQDKPSSDREILMGWHPRGRLRMSDGQSTRQISPLIAIFYELVGDWTRAIEGRDILRPEDMQALLTQDWLKDALDALPDLTRLNGPHGVSDALRASVLMPIAHREESLYASWLWWAGDNDAEPLVLHHRATGIELYADLHAFLFAKAYGADHLDLLSGRGVRHSSSGSAASTVHADATDCDTGDSPIGKGQRKPLAAYFERAA